MGTFDSLVIDVLISANVWVELKIIALERLGVYRKGAV